MGCMTGIRFPTGAWTSSLRQIGFRPHQASYPIGIGVFSPEIKRSEREAKY